MQLKLSADCYKSYNEWQVTHNQLKDHPHHHFFTANEKNRFNSHKEVDSFKILFVESFLICFSKTKGEMKF